jgi:hypothetical protein
VLNRGPHQRRIDAIRDSPKVLMVRGWRARTFSRIVNQAPTRATTRQINFGCV